MMKQNDGNDDYDNDDDGKRRQKTRVENKKAEEKREMMYSSLLCTLHDFQSEFPGKITRKERRNYPASSSFPSSLFLMSSHAR